MITIIYSASTYADIAYPTLAPTQYASTPPLTSQSVKLAPRHEERGFAGMTPER